MTQARRDNQALLHIVALLFSLSGMALRIHCLPFHTRVILLAMMRSADAAARRIAVKSGLSAAWVMPPATIDGITADEALRIAIGFRMLAVALCGFAMRGQAMLDVTDPTEIRLPETQPCRAFLLSECNLELAQFVRPFARDGPFV